MSAEKWIWLELFAFDPEADDCGVSCYIKNAGFTPDGVSLLLNAIDFVLLYNGMDEEYFLYDEVNGRGSGHKKWTNYRLRQLVRELKKYGIKVFFSVFTFYWMNKSRKEFIASHPECAVVYSEQGKTRAVDVLSRLDNGQYLEDIFAEKLYHIMCDYEFSGWHGPDWFGPGGSLKGSCSDNMVKQFVEYLGEDIPAELELDTGDQPTGLVRRVNFIMAEYHMQWFDFLIHRWEIFWKKMTDAVKKAGGECMINSPQTRSAWESSVSTGMDYRRIAAMGVKYMLVETVAANFDICKGRDEVKDRIAIYNATLQELKMAVPEMKLLFLHCIKDAGESYDVIRHSRGELEHEFFRLSNLFYREKNGSLKRCADGFMVCLGNKITSEEWQEMRGIWEYPWDLSPVEAGDFTWIFDYDGIADYRVKHLKYGIPSSAALSAYLTEHYNLHSPVICIMEELDNLISPVAVFNFDCSNQKHIDKLLKFKKAPLLLLGNICGINIPKNAAVFSVVPSDAEYQFGGIILNSNCHLATETFPDTVEPLKNYYTSIFYPFPSMKLPESFRNAIAEAWSKTLENWHGTSRTKPVASENLRSFNMRDAAGKEILAMCSYKNHYFAPELHFASDSTQIRKISTFPEFDMLNVNGQLRTEIPYTPANIPPMGILVLEINDKN